MGLSPLSPPAPQLPSQGLQPGESNARSQPQKYLIDPTEVCELLRLSQLCETPIPKAPGLLSHQIPTLGCRPGARCPEVDLLTSTLIRPPTGLFPTQTHCSSLPLCTCPLSSFTLSWTKFCLSKTFLGATKKSPSLIPIPYPIPGA